MEFSPATRAHIFPSAEVTITEDENFFATPAPRRHFPAEQSAGGLRDV